MIDKDKEILIDTGSTSDLHFREMLDTNRYEVCVVKPDSKLDSFKFLFGLMMILIGIYFLIDWILL